MASRLPEFIEALTAAADGSPALAGVVVADGPQVTNTSAREWLVVGFDGDPDGSYEAGQSVGGWATLATDREEQLQLTVAVIVMRGDTDVRAARSRAYEIALPVEQLLAADPSLGLPAAEVAIGASRLVQEQTRDGVQVRLLLQLAGRAFT